MRGTMADFVKQQRPRTIEQCPREFCGGQLLADAEGDVSCLRCGRTPQGWDRKVQEEDERERRAALGLMTSSTSNHSNYER